MRTSNLFALLPLAAVIAAGCASAPKPEPKVTVSETIAAPPAAMAATPAEQAIPPTQSSIHIEERIAKACGDLPETHFAFDSAKLEVDAAAALDALARCFSTGPLHGRSMNLVGRADPRGEVEYNLGLGQRRAGSVAGYLGEHGLAMNAMITTSRGAMDATGTDEDGWARDRRVDILLAN